MLVEAMRAVNLHSSMERLKVVYLLSEGRGRTRFTFQYGEIKSCYNAVDGAANVGFTFQYGEIKRTAN